MSVSVSDQWNVTSARPIQSELLICILLRDDMTQLSARTSIFCIFSQQSFSGIEYYNLYFFYHFVSICTFDFHFCKEYLRGKSLLIRNWLVGLYPTILIQCHSVISALKPTVRHFETCKPDKIKTCQVMLLSLQCSSALDNAHFMTQT